MEHRTRQREQLRSPAARGTLRTRTESERRFLVHCAECGNTIHATDRRWEVEASHASVLSPSLAIGDWLCSACHAEAERRQKDQYYGRLPRHLAAAGVVFHDAGRVLLVKPSYRDDTWELPGGAMDDADENPFATARREVAEELGLDIGSTPGALLAVDWVPALDGRPSLVNFLFDGGHLDQADAEQRIVLQAEELLAWRLTDRHELDNLLMPRLARRITAALDALATGTTAYLHHGRHP